jgi:predicted DNA-binding ribbon-helix-helix protein
MGASMRSTVVKRSVVFRHHKTSVSLEDEFWTSLKEIAASRKSTCSSLISEIDQGRQGPNLSSAIRQFVLDFYRERARRAASLRLQRS